MRIDLTVRDGEGDERDVALLAADGVDAARLRAALTEWCGHDGPDPVPGMRWGEPAPPTSGRRLVVVAGRDAGRSVALTATPVTVGRAPDCSLVLRDPDVSRRHVRVTPTVAGTRVTDLGSTNGSWVDDTLIERAAVTLPDDGVLRIGDTVLQVVDDRGDVATVRPGPDGTTLVNRRARPDVPEPGEIVVPEPPRAGARQRIQLAAAIVPALAGAVLAEVLHSPEFLLFSLLGPVTLLASGVADRLTGRRLHRRGRAAFQRDLAAADARIAAELYTETERRRTALPGPAYLQRVADRPLSRIWERRAGDPDLLLVRLGSGRVPSSLRRRAGGASEPAGLIENVPVAVDLASGPVGVVAPASVALPLARWLIAQLAVHCSPVDVHIALLLDETSEHRWHWARWLPHLADRVATTPDSHTLLLRGLAERVPDARTVLLVDCAEPPPLAALLESRPDLTAIVLADQASALPATCTTIVRGVGESGTRVTLGGEDIVADGVSTLWAHDTARALAPLVDASAGGASALPATSRLGELVGTPDPAAMTARWSRSDGTATATIGVRSDGPLRIDLDADGPHVLVAGTTGSGKSELLQTLVAALAAEHPAEEIEFLLVDYKGGAAFAGCSRLPHVAGLVTDLDPRLTRRALRSLEAELRRRERLFAAVGATDLRGYRAVRTDEALARLVIVVDEFATLADELPDFVPGLVAIAQRGRSLGVHLVLATQRPGRAVTPEIRANTSLRIALRTTSAADSADVVDSPLAASFDPGRPGLACIRTAASLTVAQIAYAGGPVDEADRTSVRVVPLLPWRRLPDVVDTAEEKTSELDALVAAASAATSTRARPLWRPPLPAQVALETLRAPAGATPFALVDLSGEQRQATLGVDLTVGGTMLLAGGPGSGRTSALITLARSAAARRPPTHLHVYGVGASLSSLERLAHCGTITDPAPSFAPTARLVELLALEAVRRDRPAVLLLVDGWEQFVAAAEEFDGGRTVDALLALVRDNSTAGLYTAITGGRALLAPRVSSLASTRLLLPMTDGADYALAGVVANAIPPKLAGRAVRLGDSVEVQIAVPPAISTLPSVAETSGGPRPIRLRPLPDRVAVADLPADGPGWLLGVGGDRATPVRLDLARGAARLLIAGPPRSGRTTVLRSLLAQADRPVVVAAGPRSTLANDASARGVRVLDGRTAAPVPLPDGPALLLVDDSEDLLDTALGDALTGWVRAQPEGLIAAVAARSDDLAVTFRGVAAEVRRSRCGLLLQPGPVDGELLGARLPRARETQPSGRGLLVADPAWGVDASRPLPVQLALPRSVRPAAAAQESMCG